jgi:hypothetical protein
MSCYFTVSICSPPPPKKKHVNRHTRPFSLIDLRKHRYQTRSITEYGFASCLGRGLLLLYFSGIYSRLTLHTTKKNNIHQSNMRDLAVFRVFSYFYCTLATHCVFVLVFSLQFGMRKCVRVFLPPKKLIACFGLMKETPEICHFEKEDRMCNGNRQHK